MTLYDKITQKSPEHSLTCLDSSLSDLPAVLKFWVKVVRVCVCKVEKGWLEGNKCREDLI